MKDENKEIMATAEQTDLATETPKQTSVLSELRSVETDAQRIQKQNGLGAFFQAGKNTKELAENFSRMANITKWEINTLLLVLNSHIKRKEEYEAIRNSLSGLEETLAKDTEQKEYLAKVKLALDRIKERDELNEKLVKRSRIMTIIGICAAVLSVIAIVIALL